MTETIKGTPVHHSVTHQQPPHHTVKYMCPDYELNTCTYSYHNKYLVTTMLVLFVLLFLMFMPDVTTHVTNMLRSFVGDNKYLIVGIYSALVTLIYSVINIYICKYFKQKEQNKQ